MPVRIRSRCAIHCLSYEVPHWLTQRIMKPAVTPNQPFSDGIRRVSRTHMRLDLCLLLLLLSHHQTFSPVLAVSAANQKPAPIDVHLYQCDTNTTRADDSTLPQESIVSNLIDSCNVTCCKSDRSAMCQVTVRGSPNLCIGRLCYSGMCENFSSLANLLHHPTIEHNSSVIMDRIHASFGTLAWSTVLNSTRTKLIAVLGSTSLRAEPVVLILLLVVGLSLTLVTLMIVIGSLRYASRGSRRSSYRYALL